MPDDKQPLEGQYLVQRINELNARAVAGDLPSREEVREAVLALRTERKYAAPTSGAAKKKASGDKVAKAAEKLPDDLSALFSGKKKPKAKAEEKSAQGKFDFNFLKGE